MGIRPEPVLTLRPSNCAILGAPSDVFDAMRASSPPRPDLNGCGADLYGEEAMAVQYRAWKTKHPSALDNFDKFALAAEGKQVAVFLDYDGTLSPIVEDPDRAFMSEGMRAAVKNVAAVFPTAIISGRGREKVYDFVQLAELYYAGSHGLDIMGPPPRESVARPRDFQPTNSKIMNKNNTNGSSSATVSNGVSGSSSSRSNGVERGWMGSNENESQEVAVAMAVGEDRVYLQPAREFVPMIREVSDKIRERSASIEGTSIENNIYCVSVHFRRVDEGRWEALANVVKDVVKDYPGLRLSYGRKVLEIRPTLEWDKGKAVAYLLDALNLEDVLPVYIGDDRTDEDAFAVLNERNGCGILVSRVAKNTRAAFSLRDTTEVKDFLRWLVQWKQDGLTRDGTLTEGQ